MFLLSLATIQVQAQQNELKPLRVALADQPWALQIDALGFEVTQNLTKPDGRRYLYAANKETRSVLSITLEKVKATATLDGCRKVFGSKIQPNGPFKLADIKQSQAREMAVLEYLIPEVNGIPVAQKNVFGCLVKDDVYIDIHLSKVAFKEPDPPALFAILNSSNIVVVTSEIANALPAGSFALLAEGSKFYALGELDKAIVPYQEALDLEMKEQKLDKAKWRMLVDNLSMCYGITGKFAAADRVAKYGLSKDPTYPMFYYITANIYAEQDDLENTMKYLRLALKYKGNVNPGEIVPDPRKDDSFKRFLKNKEFVKLAAQF